jgi:hypothetical protein
MKKTKHFPEGYVIPPGTKVVTRELPGGERVVKVRAEFEDYPYLLCSINGISKGICLSLEEVKLRFMN